MGRRKILLAVPCPKHGDGPCPSPGGCKARRLLAGLKPRPSGRSGTTGAERRRRAKLQQEQTMKIPSEWAFYGDDYNANCCAVCGREAGATAIRVEAEDNSIMSVTGDQRLPVGTRCRAKVPAVFVVRS